MEAPATSPILPALVSCHPDGRTAMANRYSLSRGQG
jgi:hypothetical protein